MEHKNHDLFGQETVKTIWDLDLHESIFVSIKPFFLQVTRIPTGWRYERQEGSVIYGYTVPYIEKCEYYGHQWESFVDGNTKTQNKACIACGELNSLVGMEGIEPS